MTTKQYSQLGQELWALDVLRNKKKGVFIEVGAADGITLSNTYLLEKKHGWTGLCIEPSNQYDQLVKNRSCLTDNRAILNKDGQLVDFIEDHSRDDAYLFSGIKKYIDTHEIEGDEYKKETISLDTILKEHNFHNDIDYLSIDTEGSEYEIIKDFPFYDWHIKLITIEHNYNSKKRKEIYEILSKNGFVRDEFANSQFDDWYINRSVIAKKNNYFIEKKKEFVHQLEEKKNRELQKLQQELVELKKKHTDIINKYKNEDDLTTQLKIQISKIQSDLKHTADQSRSQQKIIAAQEKAFSSIEESLDSKIGKLNKEKKNRNKFKKKIEQLNSTIERIRKESKQKLQHLTDNNQHKEEHLKRKEAELTEAILNGDTLRLEIKELNKTIGEYKIGLQNIQASYDGLEKDHNASLHSLSSLQQEWESKLADETKNRKILSDSYDEILNETNFYKKELVAKDKKINDYETSIATIEENIRKKEKELLHLNEQYSNAKKEVLHIQKSYDALLEENQDQKQTIERTQHIIATKTEELEKIHDLHKQEIETKLSFVDQLEIDKEQQNYVISYLNSKLHDLEETLVEKVRELEKVQALSAQSVTEMGHLKKESADKGLKIEELKDSLDESLSKLAQIKNENTKLFKQHSEHRTTIDKYDLKYANLLTAYNEQVAERISNLEVIKNLTTSSAVAESNLQHLNETLLQRNETIDSLNYQIDILSELKAQNTKNIQSQSKQILELKEELNVKSNIIGTMEKYIESITQEVIALRADSRNREKHLNVATSKLEEQLQLIESLNLQNGELVKDKENLIDEIKELHDQITRLNEEINSKTNAIKTFQQLKEQAIKEAEQIRKSHDKLLKISSIQENIIKNQEKEIVDKTEHYKKQLHVVKSYETRVEQDAIQVNNLTEYIGDIKTSYSWKIGYFLTRLLVPLTFLFPNRNKK